MQNPTLAVGIPVYNEEQNIVPLLKSIRTQHVPTELKAIYLYNDGSTDRTSETIVSVLKEDPWLQEKIVFIDAKENRGKSYGLNQIFDSSSEDILVLVDSDIQLQEQSTLAKIIHPFTEDAVGITSGWYRFPEELNTTSRVMNFSSMVVREVGTFKPLYLCHGGIVGLRKDAYKALYPITTPSRIDAYMYLAVTQMGFRYNFVRDVYVSIDYAHNNHLSLAWFIKIQRRSTTYPKEFLQAFNKEIIQNETGLSLKEKVLPLARSLVRHPVDGTIYLCYKTIAFCSNVMYNPTYRQPSTWRTNERTQSHS